MAELADALDLGSSSSECRFDSCYPHSKSRRAAILVGFRLLSFYSKKTPTSKVGDELRLLPT